MVRKCMVIGTLCVAVAMAPRACRGQEQRPDRPAFEGPRRKLPWLEWGPYIWDNTWDRSYFTDGVHPAPKAQEIFVDKYWKHLCDDSVAKPWLFAPAPSR